MKRIIFLSTVLLLFISCFTFAQDVRSTMFNTVDQTYNQAEEIGARLLSPGFFEKGLNLYLEAENNMKDGDDIADIRELVTEANDYFQKAIDVAKISKNVLGDVITARDDAENAEAPKFAVELWNRAEERFREALLELEDGDNKDAKEMSGEIEGLYRDAELEAIKANYLQETWELQKFADDTDVEDFAPNTLQRSKDLVKKAEKELNENRYDTDYARNLAREARYEIKHAIYLKDLIEEWQEEDKTNEQIILTAEEHIVEIARALELEARFDSGFAPVTEKLVNKAQSMLANIEMLNNEKNSLQQQVTEYKKQIEIYKKQIDEYQEQLGGIASEKSELQERLKALEELKAKSEKAESFFAPGEAYVIFQGDSIILRLAGLNFASGRAEITDDMKPLLRKVIDAIQLFENADITVEGHTDSYGSDEQNLTLSDERARVVYQFILANSNLKPDDITAIGFGEFRPIGSNDTYAGRKKNRRTDIIIKPNILSK